MLEEIATQQNPTETELWSQRIISYGSWLFLYPSDMLEP